MTLKEVAVGQTVKVAKLNGEEKDYGHGNH